MFNKVVVATCIGTLLKENNASTKSRCSINDATELKPRTLVQSEHSTKVKSNERQRTKLKIRLFFKVKRKGEKMKWKRSKTCQILSSKIVK